MTTWDDVFDDLDAERRQLADDLGEQPQPGRGRPPTETCKTHGIYQPLNIIDNGCPTCETAYAEAAAIRDADWDWRHSQHLRPF